MIKNVVFDMGNVLMQFSADAILAGLCPDPECREILKRELFGSAEWERWDAGTITREEEYDLVSRRVPEQYHEDLRTVLEGWDQYMAVYPESQQLVKDVKAAGYNTYVLSNAGENIWNFFPRFADPKEFTGMLISYTVHQLKPDPEIFRTFLKKFDLQAEECLFIDDHMPNIESARKLGFRAIQFTKNYDEIRSLLGLSSSVN